MERQREKEAETSCVCHRGQDWAMLKPAVRRQIQVSHTSDRVPSTWATFHCVSRSINKKLDWKPSNMGFQYHKPCFNSLYHNNRPYFYFLKVVSRKVVINYVVCIILKHLKFHEVIFIYLFHEVLKNTC